MGSLQCPMCRKGLFPADVAPRTIGTVTKTTWVCVCGLEAEVGPSRDGTQAIYSFLVETRPLTQRHL
jgi:hypothetical protein